MRVAAWQRPQPQLSPEGPTGAGPGQLHRHDSRQTGPAGLEEAMSCPSSGLPFLPFLGHFWHVCVSCTPLLLGE